MARSAAVVDTTVVDDSPAPDGTRAGRQAAQRAFARADVSLVALALVVGFVLRLIYSVGDHVVGNDESVYLRTGINLWNGHGFTTLGGGAELHYPPGVPFVLGAVHALIGGDPHTATLVVNVVTTTLVILPIAGITGLVLGTRAATLAAWIAALCPATMVVTLSAGGSAGLFTLLVVTALWLGLRGADRSPRSALAHAAGAGALVGAAYLTRPEGLFFVLVLVPVLVLPALGGWRSFRRAEPAAWRRALRLTGAFALPFLLLAAPYVVFLHDHTGGWQLTAKSNAPSIEAWRELASGNRAPALAEQFRLDRSGLRLHENRTSGSIVRADPVGYLGVVGRNVVEIVRLSFDTAPGPYPNWSLLPWLLFPLAAFGVWRRRHDRVVLATVAAIAVTIVTALSYFVLDRYVVPAFVLGCVLVTIGILELPRRWVRPATVVALVLLATSSAAALYGTDGWFHPNHPDPARKVVGRWIGAHSRPGDLVMSTSPVVGYYAHRVVLPTPYAEPRRVIAFARHYGARYLVVNEAFARQYRPALLSLLRKARPGLHPVFGVPATRPTNVVFALTPRPAPFRGHVPDLDHIGEAAPPSP